MQQAVQQCGDCPWCGEQCRYPPRGCPGSASLFGGEAGTGGAKLSWPFLVSSMALGWLTLSVECLFAGGGPGA
jgi:hypothetical protein